MHQQDCMRLPQSFCLADLAPPHLWPLLLCCDAAGCRTKVVLWPKMCCRAAASSRDGLPDLLHAVLPCIVLIAQQQPAAGGGICAAEPGSCRGAQGGAAVQVQRPAGTAGGVRGAASGSLWRAHSPAGVALLGHTHVHTWPCSRVHTRPPCASHMCKPQPLHATVLQLGHVWAL